MSRILLSFALLAGPAFAADLPYSVVDTGQANCYDDQGEIAPPRPGADFFGQDAQVERHPASYTLSGDGLTVADNQTGLTWVRCADTNGDGALGFADKLTLDQAKAYPGKLNAAKFAGFADWRLPSIKELFSLFDGRGVDPSGPTDVDPSRLTPFIDTRFFKFAYGDEANGERVIDSQWATSTVYAANPRQMFGVNFADGRIKGYPTSMPGRTEKTFFVLCVRGNPAYGKNNFHDNGDGTVTDRASGLMWTKADSGKGLNWPDALAWVQAKNRANYLGHSDWRLPNVKELQSIVEYSRSPDTTKSAALDPVFQCTPIQNEDHKADFPFFWSSTTHGGFMGGTAAMYVAFGRASGWVSPRGMGGGPGGPGGPGGGPPEGAGGRGGPPPGGFGRGPGRGGPPGGGRGSGRGEAGEYRFLDVHGAGAQRSDPKTGDPAKFPHGRGPQGDVIRIFNFVRCVRDAG